MTFAEKLRKLKAFVFDFSAAERDRQETEEILRAALTLRNGDIAFEDALREVLNQRFGPKEGVHRHGRMLFFLHQQRKVNEAGTPLRLLAEQTLQDLPRLFGTKEIGGR